MVNSKQELLSEFERIISELKLLIADIPDYSHDRNNRGIREYISSDNSEKYIELRTQCLVLLNRISSPDVNLKDAIDFIRDAEIALWNIRKTLEKMQTLRAEFAAGLLTDHPRLYTPYSQIPEKKSWLSENRTKIIVAIITALAAIAATAIPKIIEENNQQNAVTVTLTAIATINSISSPTP